jgi:hypothetical protein
MTANQDMPAVTGSRRRGTAVVYQRLATSSDSTCTRMLACASDAQNGCTSAVCLSFTRSIRRSGGRLLRLGFTAAGHPGPASVPGACPDPTVKPEACRSVPVRLICPLTAADRRAKNWDAHPRSSSHSQPALLSVT